MKEFVTYKKKNPSHHTGKMDKEFFTNLNLNQERIAKLVECHYIPMKCIKELRKTENFLDFVNSKEIRNLLID
jgi:hypothetical protein